MIKLNDVIVKEVIERKEYIDNETIWETMMIVNTDGKQMEFSRHCGTGKGCMWTDWEGGYINTFAENGIILAE